jgi:hypothetical protein
MAINAPLTTGHTFSSTDTITHTLLNKAFDLARALVPTPIGTASGGTGATSIANAQANLQVMGRLEAWVEYTDDGSAVDLGTLPADSFVYDVMVHVTEAFDDSGTDLLTVGWTADNDALSTSLDVSTTGVKSPTHGANDGYNSSSQTVKAYYNGSNSDATVGKALVIVLFCQVSTTP